MKLYRVFYSYKGQGENMVDTRGISVLTNTLEKAITVVRNQFANDENFYEIIGCEVATKDIVIIDVDTYNEVFNHTEEN